MPHGFTTAPLIERASASGSRGLARYVPIKPVRMTNSRPLVSFTFDDVPDSALTNGATTLDKYSIKGTFYISPGILGAKDEFWRVISAAGVIDLHERGHEIACHTWGHVKVQSLTAAELQCENARSFTDLRKLCGDLPLRNFAYPFGSVSFPRKLELAQTFASCRSIYEGLNSGVADLAMLRVKELYDRTRSPESIDEILDEVERRNAWLIFYTHDVSNDPSWIGCSPWLLEHAVRRVQARGIACVSVDEALNRISSR